MDPNAEGGPPKTEISDVEIDVDFGLRDNPIVPPPINSPLSAGSIFRTAYGQQSHPPPSSLPSRVEQNGETSSSSNPGLSQETDPEKIRAAQEEMFQRRLRGEYEAAQQRLGSVVNSNMDRPLRLTSIRLSPCPPTTRSSFLDSLLSPFISLQSSYLPRWLNPAPPPPQTLHEILLTTKALVDHIDRFGVFDVSQTGVRLENRRGGDDDEVELVLGLKERGRLFLKAGTEVGAGEGGGNVTARVRNALGGGESLEGQASVGTKTKSSYQLSLTTPVLASPLLSFALAAFSFDRDNTAFASHREHAQGGRATLSAIAPWGKHDLAYEYIQRDIGHLAPNASVSIRELARSSNKSSLSHTWTSDTRDDPWWGTRGRLLKLTHEYAGLPGSSASTHFLKSVTQSHLSRALYTGSNINFSIASLTSILYPLSTHPTELPDRLFLGGPNSVRGYKVGGMGLHDQLDSLGGELSWSGGLSVFTPLWPNKAHWPARAHGFLNVGKVVGYDRDRGIADNAVKMYKNPNVTVGLGLMYRLDPIRIEINFTMPLIGRKGERMSRGLGVGVGLEFL